MTEGMAGHFFDPLNDDWKVEDEDLTPHAKSLPAEMKQKSSMQTKTTHDCEEGCLGRP